MDIRLIENFDRRSAYSEPHILKVLLSMNGPIGREKIMKSTGINEASARTMLNFLTRRGLLRSTKKGHTPTKKCENMVKFLKTNIRGPITLEKTPIAIGKKNIAYVVKKKANKIRYGIEQRDQAIIMGAHGLTTIVKKGKIYMPGDSRSVKLDISLEDDDVLLIGSAGNEKTAEFAALYAAYLLLR